MEWIANWDDLRNRVADDLTKRGISLGSAKFEAVLWHTYYDYAERFPTRIIAGPAPVSTPSHTVTDGAKPREAGHERDNLTLDELFAHYTHAKQLDLKMRDQ